MPTFETEIDGTKEDIRAAIQDETEFLWFPGLAEPLSRIAWGQLQRDIGLNEASYSTARLLLRNPTEEYRIVARCRPRPNRAVEACHGEIPIEFLTTDIARLVTDNDVQFLDRNSIKGAVHQQLEDALSLLNLVPTIWTTVCTLVRSLHVIDPGGDENDVSFSDPLLPFSIFVSVPSALSEVAVLRIAESILHESMHLQLTLVERITPLVEPQGMKYYSPWRDETRDSEGILQALYAFGVIRSFFAAAPAWCSPEANDHVASRREQIGFQMRQAQSFKNCDELTADGLALVARLLAISE